MLVLGGEAALNVTERWVRVYDAKVAQVLQRHQVLALAQAVQPAAAESQGPKVFIDHIQEMFSSRKSASTERETRVHPTSKQDALFSHPGRRDEATSQPDGHVSDVEVFHVMRTLHVVVDRSFSCAAKCFNGIGFTFLRGHKQTKLDPLVDTE